MHNKVVETRASRISRTPELDTSTFSELFTHSARRVLVSPSYDPRSARNFAIKAKGPSGARACTSHVHRRLRLADRWARHSTNSKRRTRSRVAPSSGLAQTAHVLRPRFAAAQFDLRSSNRKSECRESRAAQLFQFAVHLRVRHLCATLCSSPFSFLLLEPFTVERASSNCCQLAERRVLKRRRTPIAFEFVQFRIVIISCLVF